MAKKKAKKSKGNPQQSPSAPPPAPEPEPEPEAAPAVEPAPLSQDPSYDDDTSNSETDTDSDTDEELEPFPLPLSLNMPRRMSGTRRPSGGSMSPTFGQKQKPVVSLDAGTLAKMTHILARFPDPTSGASAKDDADGIGTEAAHSGWQEGPLFGEATATEAHSSSSSAATTASESSLTSGISAAISGFRGLWG